MPGAPLLIFDGDCGFCTSAKDWILARLDPALGVEAVPYQWADLDGLGIAPEAAARRVWVLGAGEWRGGGAAIAWLLRHARGRGWRIAGAIAAAPVLRWATEAGYRIVAANRHRLPGGTPACRLPQR